MTITPTGSPGAAALSVSSVTKQFRKAGRSVTALSDISFEVAAGSFVSLIGRSGCGKTTLLRLLAGLETPTRGTVRSEQQEPHRSASGIVFQAPTLLPWKSVRENIQLPHVLGRRGRHRMSAGEVDQHTRHLLDLVALDAFADALPAELSGGMQQRVAIARALFSDPGILYMDEPFAALDALTREQMVLELHRLWRATAKTVVFVTHDITEALMLSTDIIVLSARPGRIAHHLHLDLPSDRDVALKRLPAFQEYEQFLHAALGEGQAGA
jgi:NitT/TauT family transport system ATP-binding protein